MITMTDQWKIRKNMRPDTPLPEDNINKPKLNVLEPTVMYCGSCYAKIMPDGSCRCT